MILARGLFSSTRRRSRTRLMEVSEVSAEAAKPARISAIKMTSSSMSAVASMKRFSSSRWARSSKEFGDRTVLVHPADGLSQQGRDGEDLELGVLLLGRHGHGVGDHDLVDGGRSQPLHRLAGEH